MKSKLLLTVLTVTNLVLLGFQLINNKKSHAQAEHSVASEVLRGRGLEIVDSLGKVRASISFQPEVEIDQVVYPPTVLFRLIDNQGSPVVKISGADNGAGMSLSDRNDGGVRLIAKEGRSFLEVSAEGHRKIIEPSF